MMESLLTGTPASRLFRTLLHEDTSMDAWKLDQILIRELPNISPAASIAIRRWGSLGSIVISDEDLDALISHFLVEAGYAT